MIVTRFAPSPTGYLHLGHAYSALQAYNAAQQGNGKFLLRIEDIDPIRCKPEYTQAIFEDLRWLGLNWEEPVRKQSEHMEDYAHALEKLHSLGVLYPCACTRSDIAREAEASAHAPHLAPHGPDGLIYPGTCRKRNLVPSPANWRLDVAKALQLTGPLIWRDRDKGRIEARPKDFGDIVLARKDIAASYHLSVTVDDHLQGITLVTRGEDLFRATDIHRLLQALLGYDTPEYCHHPLLKDASGKRYAKRNKAITLRELRASGSTPEEIRLSALSPPTAP